MKKLLMVLCFCVMISAIPYTLSFAQESVMETLLPQNIPEDYMAFRCVDGNETSGVMFVLTEILFCDDVLQINVFQLPNDNGISLIDNQVDYGEDTTYLDKEIKIASEYGDQVLGTICDIAYITDENGNNLLTEYSASCNRIGSSLHTQFHVYYLPANIKMDVGLSFGVQENLDNRIFIDNELHMKIPASNQYQQ